MTNTASIDSVGIIGIGAMGWPMATNLQRRGNSPCVCDIDPQAVAAATGCGLVACDSAAALAARCDIAIVVVVDAMQIDALLFGEGCVGGLVQALLPAGARRQTVVLCSTIAAADSEHFKPESILDLMST